MATVIRGTAVIFGFQTTTNGITMTGISGTLLQSANVNRTSTQTLVLNAIGDRVSEVFSDQVDNSTLEFVVTGTDAANAIVNNVKQNPGTLLAITACASNTELIASNWIITDSAQSGGNTSVAKVTFTIHKAAGITT